ncbi:DUF3017 domain-containing protein [Propionibacteriaceae bacterium Y1923]|uniref:DUF3017 domain-containing protein n=1 Tax=Aestuariimicrobium sp. Y1814 TaxID=3418742 RepID=UPI003C29EC4D
MSSGGAPGAPGGMLTKLRNQWTLFLVLLAMAGSCAYFAAGHWRRGAFAFGMTVLLAGVFRLVLPTRRVGLLAVRSRWFDCLLLLGAAAALIMLTLVVPPSPPPSAG